jgi:hypothetical protein
MKTVLQIIGTILTVILAAIIALLGPAVAGSSHNISMDSRDNAMLISRLALIIGPLLIIAIWFPWKKYRKK